MRTSLLDSPISGGNPMAIAGTLAIIIGGDRETFDKVESLLACIGNPVYTGSSGSGNITKLVNNVAAGAYIHGSHCRGICICGESGN